MQWLFCCYSDRDMIKYQCIKNKYRIHNIIYQFSQQLKDIMESKLTKVIVYGSYARGDYNSSSDVDVMILIKMSDNEIKKIENQVYDLAFDIEMDTGVDISPIIKNEEQYEYWLDTLPFYKNIHEEASGIKRNTISRPTAYGEYAPYTFIENEEEFEKLVEKMK